MLKNYEITSESPCNNHCNLNRLLNICMGCNRKIEEITNWQNFSDEEKIKINKRLYMEKKNES
jgi:predicted Fe-S protein YdhL (DUF1289 family)